MKEQCKDCKIDLEICDSFDPWSDEYWFCPNCDATYFFPHQPERSKREDTLKTKDSIVAMASMRKAMPQFNYVINDNGSIEKVMRCSEHCGNTVREVQ